MKSGIKVLKLILLIGSTIMLSGCIIIYFPYFRNLSDDSVEIIFKTAYYESNVSAILYKKEVLPINKKTYKQLNDSLDVTSLQSNQFHITIPSKSTVLLPRWLNLSSDTIIVKQKDRIDTISIHGKYRNNNSFQIKKHGFPVANLLSYDYK